MLNKDIVEIYNQHIKEFYNDFSKKKERKVLSQFFTPLEEAEKMVENLEIISQEKINILEPSCGYGILIIVLLKKILSLYIPKKIKIYICDIDKNMIEVTEKILTLFFKENNFHNFEIESFHRDFLSLEINEGMDYIISNPPYKKINMKLAPQELVKKYINGQPNLYYLFVGKSLESLAERGKYIVICPKGYLSGKYCTSLRKNIVKNLSITKLHIFSERNKIFGDEILQEICITQIEKRAKEDLLLSYSGYAPFEVKFASLLVPNESFIIKTPRSREELEINEKFEKIFCKKNIGSEIFFKPGKVVQFRIKKEKGAILSCEKYSEVENAVPLFILKHIDKGKINYNGFLEKNISIVYDEKIKTSFIENKNYLFLRKNIEKSYSKLINSAMYLKKYFDVNKIGLDNNLGYFTNKNDDLTEEELRGLYIVLNSKQFDNYYRMFSSNHTINAYELNNLNFPSLDTLKLIGKENKKMDNYDVENCSYIFEKYFVE